MAAPPPLQSATRATRRVMGRPRWSYVDCQVVRLGGRDNGVQVVVRDGRCHSGDGAGVAARSAALRRSPRTDTVGPMSSYSLGHLTGLLCCPVLLVGAVVAIVMLMRRRRKHQAPPYPPASPYPPYPTPGPPGPPPAPPAGSSSDRTEP